MVGAPAAGDLLRTLGNAHGNPFFITDLLTGLRQDELIAVADGRAHLVQDRVPHLLEDSMRRRLSRTHPAGERVVTVAALAPAVHAESDRRDGAPAGRGPR